MASVARRIKASSINWAAIAERVPENQKSQYLAFKAKSDGYLRRMLSQPEEPPKIDWAFYKTSVAVPGMVEDFQKKYDALKIPYPADNLTPQIEAQKQEAAKEVKEYINASNARIASYEAELAKIRAMLPFEMMTMEDFRDAYPDQALDPLNRPTFWPHEPEDQPDYEEETPQAEAKH
ncbi:ATP synthase subunit d, mitochondrial [Bacillus rossius redtenbacheri]|uniref:ATP synthase subunit d, mitochondrial n=1 Tax=Bacillus rossius redtenbacheri TaxID=93214 RepID=UPI002FDCF371